MGASVLSGIASLAAEIVGIGGNLQSAVEYGIGLSPDGFDIDSAVETFSEAQSDSEVIISLAQSIWDVARSADTVGSDVVAFLESAVDLLRNVFNNILGAVEAFFHLLWQAFIKRIVGLIRSLLAWLGPYVRHVISILQKIRKYEQAAYDQFIRPILNLIQRLRAALLIFRLLHLKFATTLDADLARIEGEIINVVYWNLAQLNQIITYLDLLIDPSGFMRSYYYIGAAVKSIGAMFALLHAAQTSPLTAGQQTAQASASQTMNRTSLLEDTHATVNGGLQGIYATHYDGITAALQARGYYL